MGEDQPKNMLAQRRSLERTRSDGVRSSMHRIKWFVIALFGMAPLLAACPPRDITACDPLGCISQRAFLQNIVSLLDGNVTGYVVYVGGLPPVFSGQARTSADPPGLAMLPTESTDIASVSKLLTTVGVLQSLGNHNLTIDDPISPYIYADWQQGPNINTITFRDLLTHKSGFPGNTTCGGNNTTYSILETIIANGVSPGHEGAPAVYSNCNFAIFRELLSPMEGNQIGNLPDDQRAQASANFYIDYINQNVFAPLGIQPQSCMPTTDPAFDMLSYPFPPGSTNGTDWGDWTLACGGGGWNITAGNIFAFINDLANGNVLLTAGQRAQMNAQPYGLGWDNTVQRICAGPNFPAPYFCKNGSLGPDGMGREIWTYAGIFKCAVPVVVVVNSPLPPAFENSNDIIQLVAMAYNMATNDNNSRAPACFYRP